VIGTTLQNRYRLDAVLGQGGMGVVYRAHDTLLGRAVAVKVVSKTTLGTEGRARLMHEAQAAAQLNHPNIVSIYDAGESEGLPFIVMEWVKGDNLDDRRPTELDQIVSYARHICAALQHAHAQGFVHRDLKPENVLIARDGTAKLTDFGLARSMASRITDEGTIVGSVFYLAPELALGQEYDGRADLYALGVMLYELTTGRLPFAGDDPVAVISQHLHAPVVAPRARNAEIPPALDALIVRLLSKSPQDRPSSAAEVLHILQQPVLLDKDALPAKELSLLERIERGRMVGRDHELQQARALWSRALAGEGQMLLVSGEPGIGKTRLIREMATQVEVTGGRSLVGASYAEGGTPYAPFAQMIREVLRNGPRDGLDLPEFVWADVLTLAPELRSRHPDVPANPALDPQAEQQRLFENLLIFFTALSDQAPRLLVLEDAHWADSGSLFLLRHLARNTRAQRVMIVATYREVELDEARPLHSVLLDLQRERLATRLKLHRLDRAQTGEMLSVLFGEETTPEFLDGIYRETEGNPFFIEEVCKALVESGELYYQDGRWNPPRVEQLAIPQSVRVAIQSRVGNLPSDAQQTLRLAAVLGREFESEVLSQASELDEDTLIDALESAERAQLIQEVGGEGSGTFAFVHGLIPATLVESLRTLQRRRLHRRAAAAITARHPDDFEALAHHHSQARQPQKATGYLLQAADRARGLYAHQEAIAHYQQALEFLTEAGDVEQSARTFMKLGLTYHNAFEFKAARQAYEEGFALWRQAGEAEPTVRPPSAPHALRVSGSDPLTLDSTMAGDGDSAAVIEELFSGLVARSPEMDVIPDVASTWELLEGGRKYVFHLRDDVQWSDGTPLTARDFEYAWKRVLDPASGAPLASLLHDIKGARAFNRGDAESAAVGVRAADDLTLVVELEGPTAYFLQLMACVTTYPVPRHIAEALGPAWTQPENIVTNGPFQLQAWTSSQSMAFIRNSHYHGRFAGNVQRVEVSLLADPSLRLQMYEDARLDIVSLPPAEMGGTRQQHAGEYLSLPAPSTHCLGFDTTQPPFDDPRVRRAFVLATDRETLAHAVRQGNAFPATGGFLPPGMPGHSAGIGLPHDPVRAPELLADAGYPGGRGFPVVKLATSPAQASDARYLLAQWRDSLGVDITLQRTSDAIYPRGLRSEAPHMFLSGWHADYPDPDNFLRVGFPWDSTGWRNASYEKLVEDARHVPDQPERIKLYQQADRILVQEAPIMPLIYGRWHLLIKPWVQKFPTSAIKLWFWKDVIIEPH
jgi:ABC-type oligopeptide transport system substrate-binding subunit/predicted Ser/Thr protein kinase